MMSGSSVESFALADLCQVETIARFAGVALSADGKGILSGPSERIAIAKALIPLAAMGVEMNYRFTVDEIIALIAEADPRSLVVQMVINTYDEVNVYVCSPPDFLAQRLLLLDARGGVFLAGSYLTPDGRENGQCSRGELIARLREEIRPSFIFGREVTYPDS